MRSNPVLTVTIFTLITLAIDAYVWWGISKIIPEYSQRFKRIIKWLYWIVPVLIIAGLILVLAIQHHIPGDKMLSYFHAVSGAFVLFYVPKLVFVIFNIFDDIIFQIRKGITLLVRKKASSSEQVTSVSRRKFLNQAGVVFAAVPFVSLFYGIKIGRFDFSLREISLNFTRLPDRFDGIKIVQISDFHIGTFLHYKDRVREVVDLVNEQNADLVVFTGDLVNNLSIELDPFMDILRGLRAGMGKYSILGNHDYGEYVPWKSEKEKQDNLERLVGLEREAEFDLLLDESRQIERDGQVIELIGIENWGLPPIPQYGDLEKAMQDTDPQNFKILLSHDPTHWDAQVVDKTDIDLMLAGHTHGAQFGIEIPGWRWSPATVRYKQWGGLYSEGMQQLYINTGLGSIGYPGRVGMPPEITVFTLNKG